MMMKEDFRITLGTQHVQMQIKQLRKFLYGDENDRISDVSKCLKEI